MADTLETSAGTALQNAQQEQEKIKQFCALWQGAVRPVLDHFKAFPKVGKMITELETALDNVCNSTNPDIQNYCLLWNKFHLESVLNFVKGIAGPKVKKALNQFIELSDELCPAQA